MGAERARAMVRLAAVHSSFLIGFDAGERTLGNAGADGYPPYNIERILGSADKPERLRITLAVAGFAPDEIEVSQEDGQLRVKGRSQDERGGDFLHRGIAARQFQRNFPLAAGVEVQAARLDQGLLAIDMVRPKLEAAAKRIEIVARG